MHVLGGSTNLLLHLLRVKHTDEPPVTEEELLVQLNEGTQAGVFEESEQDMVEGVFSLSDQRVNALMTPRNEIVWLDVNDTVAEIRRKVKDSPFSRFPVGDDSLDNVVGVIKAKDLLLADLKSGKQLKEIARPPLFVPETAFGSRALEILKEAKREMVLVVDEFGVVQGLLTLADILEEIVGAFEGEPQATQRQDGSWLLDGMLPNDEFKEIFNLRRLPDEEEYETLGGFVMLHLGRIPQAADLFEWNGLRFEVMDMDGKRVDKILVTTIPAKPPARRNNLASSLDLEPAFHPGVRPSSGAAGWWLPPSRWQPPPGWKFYPRAEMPPMQPWRLPQRSMSPSPPPPAWAGICSPCSTRPPPGRMTALNGSGRAPASLTLDLLRKNGLVTGAFRLSTPIRSPSPGRARAGAI